MNPLFLDVPKFLFPRVIYLTVTSHYISTPTFLLFLAQEVGVM